MCMRSDYIVICVCAYTDECRVKNGETVTFVVLLI